MATTKIRGLTIELGADTSKLGKALEEVGAKSKNISKELQDVNRLLKLDPGNADLLAQKQKILADAVDTTAERLAALKEAERKVQEQFAKGDATEEQVRALEREVINCAKALDGYEQAAKDTADAVDNLGKKSKEALEQTAQVNDKLAGGLAKGLGGVATATAAAVTALAGTAEATREYRNEMAKLDTAFTQNGFTTEAAKGAYTELQGILGDTDQAVEAANHLAKLTDNEKDLAKWTGDILPGVYATFGASLPLEGLTEAANETAKVGQVTGPLADALNWAGVSEDAFNEKLAKCSTEQERQALIMETLNGLYGDASAAYKETNADVIAANQANEKWAASMAEVGAFMEPVVTEVKSFGADLLSMVVPAIQAILDNLPAVGVVLGGVTAAMVAFKIASLAATAASKGMTLAQYGMAAAQKALNVVMNANPIGLIILAITALVATFMVLWKNCESFRNFWIKLWDKIKTTALKVGDALKELPSKIYNAIMGAVDRVKQWGTDMVDKAKSGMKNLVTTVVTTLKELPKKVLSVGKDLVTGLWNGVKDKLSWLKSKLSGFATSVLDGIKGFFGVNSPSKETAWVGEMLDEGLAKGVEDNAKTPVRAMQTVSGGVLDAAAGVNGLTLTRNLSSSRMASVAASAGVGGNAALLAKLDEVCERLTHLQVVTETGALVGEIIDKVDGALANRQALSARGV